VIPYSLQLPEALDMPDLHSIREDLSKQAEYDDNNVSAPLPAPSIVIKAISIPAAKFVNSNARSSLKPPLLFLQPVPGRKDELVDSIVTINASNRRSIPHLINSVELPDPLHIYLDREISGAVGMNRYYSLLNLHYIFRSQLLRPVLPQCICPRWANLVLKTCNSLPLTYPSVHPLGPSEDVPAGMTLHMLTPCQLPTAVLIMTMLAPVWLLLMFYFMNQIFLSISEEIESNIPVNQ
jgi:hypothetical protein